jgi:hypothetical protein
MGLERVDYNLPMYLFSCNIMCKSIECMIEHKYSDYLYKTLVLITVQACTHISI